MQIFLNQFNSMDNTASEQPPITTQFCNLATKISYMTQMCDFIVCLANF